MSGSYSHTKNEQRVLGPSGFKSIFAFVIIEKLASGMLQRIVFRLQRKILLFPCFLSMQILIAMMIVVNHIKHESEAPSIEKPAKIVIFQHVHKTGGTFFMNTIRGMRDQRLSADHALIFCPRRNRLSLHMHRNYLVPFWTWPASAQEIFLAKLGKTFVANERYLGDELIAIKDRQDFIPSQQPSFRYLTIIRDPLDRIVSHYFFAKVIGRNQISQFSGNFSSFISLGPCQFSDAGFQCWDSNLFVQVFSGSNACTQPDTTHDVKNHGVQCERLDRSCGPTSPTNLTRKHLEDAKRRLSESFVVLNLDWLPYSAPLLCAELGYCGSDFEVALNGTVNYASCGAVETLSEWPDAEGLISRMRENNALDLEFYSFAKQIAEQQLRAAGVHGPLPLSGLKRSCIRASKDGISMHFGYAKHHENSSTFSVAEMTDEESVLDNHSVLKKKTVNQDRPVPHISKSVPASALSVRREQAVVGFAVAAAGRELVRLGILKRPIVSMMN